MILQGVQFVTRALLTLTLILRVVSTKSFFDNPEYKIINRVIKQCSINSENKYFCLANKAAIAMERAINTDIPLFDGITLVRNEDYVNNEITPRGSSDGISRLSTAVSKFLDSHVVKVDLMKEEGRRKDSGIGLSEGSGGGDGGGGLGGSDTKKGNKEKKYLQYALMVLLGVFGISGPLIMKTLALLAGKALVASKIALLIVGSVALKKIFEKDHSYSTVKVHTHTIKDYSDSYDRNSDSSPYKFVDTI